jgi:hypothetical protein
MFIVNRYRLTSPLFCGGAAGHIDRDVGRAPPAAPLQNKRETTGWPTLAINRAPLRGLVPLRQSSGVLVL